MDILIRFPEEYKTSTSPMVTGKKPKVKSSVMINEDVWKEIRILAIRENKEIGKLVEEIFRERLERGREPQLAQPQTQTQEEIELKQLIKELAKDWAMTEQQTVEFIKERAQDYGISELDHARYLKVDKKVSHTIKREKEPEELIEFIAEYSKRSGKPEGETRELLRFQAEQQGLSFPEFIQHLILMEKVDKHNKELERERKREQEERENTREERERKILEGKPKT